MPASVGLTVRPARRTRGAPNSSSSALMRVATAADVSSSRRAASASEPQSTTMTKLCRKRISMRCNPEITVV